MHLDQHSASKDEGRGMITRKIDESKIGQVRTFKINTNNVTREWQRLPARFDSALKLFRAHR